MSDEHHGTDIKFLAGFFIGGLLGAATIFLLGTKEGKKAKDILQKKGKDVFTDLENEIEKASGVSKNLMGLPDHPEMTATQTNQMISGASMRISRRLMILAEEGIVPSIEIIARMIAENTDYDQIDKIKYRLSDGQEKTGIVDAAIRSGEYKYTIGSTQSIIEKKAKINELAPLIQQFTQLGVKFDNAKLWNMAAQAFEIPDASQLIESDGLTQALQNFPPEMQDTIKNHLTQLVPEVPAVIEHVNQQPQEQQ